MIYLIDGYNLLYAMGLASRGLPQKKLARARSQLLDWLADQIPDPPLMFPARSDSFRVVFDAQNGIAPSAESDHRGIAVRFAFRRTADELIEELVRAEPHPERVAVVSNDGQVQDSGRRRGCSVLRCEEFVDRLISRPIPPTTIADSPREESATPEEMAAWLEVFSQPKKRRKK